jgi:hypothetical protein
MWTTTLAVIAVFAYLLVGFAATVLYPWPMPIKFKIKLCLLWLPAFVSNRFWNYLHS